MRAPRSRRVEQVDHASGEHGVAGVSTPVLSDRYDASESVRAINRVAAGTRSKAAWMRLDAHLSANGPYLLGESFSAADLMLLMRCATCPSRQLNGSVAGVRARHEIEAKLEAALRTREGHWLGLRFLRSPTAPID